MSQSVSESSTGLRGPDNGPSAGSERLPVDSSSWPSLAALIGLGRLLDALFGPELILCDGEKGAWIIRLDGIDPERVSLADCQRLVAEAGKVPDGDLDVDGKAVFLIDSAADPDAWLAARRPRLLAWHRPGTPDPAMEWRVQAKDRAAEALPDFLATCWARLHQAAAHSPDIALGDLSLFDPAERFLLAGVMQIRSPAPFVPFVARLTEIVARSPELSAIETDSLTLDYRALWDLSSRFCGLLAQHGIDRGGRLLILAERVPELVIAIVAAMRRGAVICLVDPRQPDAYLTAAIEAVRPDLVLDLAGRGLAMQGGKQLAKPSFAELASLPPIEGHGEDRHGADDLAIIALTSGTSGRPKVVAGRYGSLVYFFDWMERQFGPMAGARFGLCSGLGHDPLQRDIFTPLYLGGTICIPEGMDLTQPLRLPRWLRAARVDTVCLTPPQLAFLAGDDAPLPDLRRAFFVGAALRRDQAEMLRRQAPGVRIVAMYGATETQRAVGFVELPAEREALVRFPAMIPVGRGMKDTEVFVLDTPRKRPALPYQSGDIVVRSRFVARGYLDASPKDSARFGTGLLGPRDDVPAYLTGDRGHLCLADGVIFAGRADSERKIDGHRVDLEQVAGACREHRLVTDAAMIVTQSGERTLLAAFLVSADPAIRFDSTGFRSFLASRLPRYMLPHLIDTVPAMPLTLSGKIDQAALADRARAILARSMPADAGSYDITGAIARFVAENTGLPSVPADRTMEELGIDSLRFATMMVELRDRFRIDVSSCTLHNRLSLGDLVSRLMGRMDQTAPTGVAPSGSDLMAAVAAGGGQKRPEAIARGSGPYLHPSNGGGPLLGFCSNDYLGLARHPVVVAAFRDTAATNGVGACSSRLLSGFHPLHEALEKRLATFLGMPDVAMLTCGFLAIQGAVLSFFDGLDGTPGVVLDALTHPAAQYAADRSGVLVERYRHADAADLDRLLAAAPTGRRIVVSDGVFSATGEVAPVAALAAAARRHGAIFALDDAHGVGVLGRTGRGTLEHQGIAPAGIDLLVGTCSKAFGTFGAFVAGSEAIVSHVRRVARSYALSTSPPPALAAATLASLDVMAQEPWRRMQLAALVDRFRNATAGLPLIASETPIQVIDLDRPERLAALCASLAEDGFHLGAAPGRGQTRLRISITVDHEVEHVDRLANRLRYHLAVT